MITPRRLTFSFSRNGNLASINPEVDNEVLVKKTDNNYVRIGDFANVKITSVDYFDLFGEVVV